MRIHKIHEVLSGRDVLILSPGYERNVPTDQDYSDNACINQNICINQNVINDSFHKKPDDFFTIRKDLRNRNVNKIIIDGLDVNSIPSNIDALSVEYNVNCAPDGNKNFLSSNKSTNCMTTPLFKLKSPLVIHNGTSNTNDVKFPNHPIYFGNNSHSENSVFPTAKTSQSETLGNPLKSDVPENTKFFAL